MRAYSYRRVEYAESMKCAAPHADVSLGACRKFSAQWFDLSALEVEQPCEGHNIGKTSLPLCAVSLQATCIVAHRRLSGTSPHDNELWIYEAPLHRCAPNLVYSTSAALQLGVVCTAKLKYVLQNNRSSSRRNRHG